MAAASAEALRCAAAGIDDVAHLDLYSCFASSVNFARDALGMGDDDGRAITVTGGLPFAGGAGSDYMMHSIATMAGVLRDDPGSRGLVSGVGMHMTKHVFGVYSTEPRPVRPPAPMPEPEAVPIVDTYAGRATVATYTVVHARGGVPEWGLAICDVPGGGRCYRDRVRTSVGHRNGTYRNARRCLGDASSDQDHLEGAGRQRKRSCADPLWRQRQSRQCENLARRGRRGRIARRRRVARSGRMGGNLPHLTRGAKSCDICGLDRLTHLTVSDRCCIRS